MVIHFEFKTRSNQSAINVDARIVGIGWQRTRSRDPGPASVHSGTVQPAGG